MNLSMDIREHGSWVDKKKDRVKCNYCGKEMRGFDRLKFHLAGVRGGHVTPCEQVTDTVRETFRKMVMEETSSAAANNRVDKVQMGNSGSLSVFSGLGESLTADTFVMDIYDHGVIVNKKRRRVKCKHCGKDMFGLHRLKRHLGGVGTDVTSCEKVTFTVREAFQKMVMEERSSVAAAAKTERVGEVQKGNAHKRGRREASSSKSVSPENGNACVEATKQDLRSNGAKKWIGRCSNENRFDFSAVGSTGFREMMTVSGGKIPDSCDLNGRMRQEALKEVQDHVRKIKDSWAITGCSILLDAWVDEKGRDLVTFVADCPAGPVYLISLDVSEIKSNSNALISLVHGLIDEVGMHNVIQIIASSASGWVGELGESFSRSKEGIFWSLSVSRCFEYMLLKIAEIHSLGDIVDKANKITEFVNKNSVVLKLVRDHSHGTDMTVSSSELKFVSPYLTLESMFKAKNHLADMFASSDWNKEEDITISELVNDSSFWEIVDRVLKSTSPLIHGLLWFCTANNQHVGNIYETMDVIKENIAKKFNHEELCYKPVWDVIDDVWNNYLHSPLHAAGYFLNPTVFYSTDFHLDQEVATGLISSLVHIVKECDIQVRVATQLDMYRLGEDCFNEASQADQITGIAPAEWWAQKASKHQELPSFAIKVLSQTCEGASRYKLERSVAEKLLLTEGMSHGEKQHLEELAFVHYNLHLQSCKAKLSEEQ